MWRSNLVYFLKALLVVCMATGIAYLFFVAQYWAGGVSLLAFILFVFYGIHRERRLLRYLLEFSEGIQYRDFTRNFHVQRPKSPEGRLFSAFNTINKTFQQIRSEHEVQHQYLEKVINMLDAGLVLFQIETGKVIWTNNAFKQMLGTPHIRQIKGLNKKNPALYQKTLELKSGIQDMELIQSAKGDLKLLIQAVNFGTREGTFRIVSYQNINEAIDHTETRAWHKLLRVLTHEIMNSITPITSLAETLHNKLEQLDDDGDFGDVKLGVATIRKRSEGLINFAKSYRMINKVDEPRYRDVSILQLFENIHQLLDPTLLEKNIALDIVIQNTRILLHIDQHLIEQVLINVLINAVDAVKNVEKPYIGMRALEKDSHVQIQVEDNGIGISPEILDQIFTPFFTTKPSGSGVGLTLSKQIMLLHNGNIFIHSKVGEGTLVSLRF